MESGKRKFISTFHFFIRHYYYPYSNYSLKFFILLSVILLLHSSPLYAQYKVLSFQGQLTNVDGSAVNNGEYNLDFTLYDAAQGGNILWEEKQLNVPVNNGLFQTYLGINQPLNTLNFDTTYYLGISVNGGEEMAPRSQLTASPYAQRARLLKDGALEAGSGIAITPQSNGQLKIAMGAINFTVNNDSAGIFINQKGSGEAARFISSGPIGLYSTTKSGSSNSTGIKGEVDTTQAEGFSVGVTGINQSTNSNGVGVFGTQRGSGWGVYGVAPAGRGVYGYSPDGIGGYFASTNGTALYASGDANINGNTTTNKVIYSSARTHNLSLGPADFVTPGNNVNYFLLEDEISSAATGTSYMMAALHLPDGANISQFKMFYRDIDGGTGDTNIYFYRLNLSTGNTVLVASLTPNGSSGRQVVSTGNISSGMVDNSQYSYFIQTTSSDWANFRIVGSVISYQLSEAP